MKILFLTEGGSDIGFGHITRCISLCQAFEERGITPEFVVNGDSVVGDLLRGRKSQIFNWLKEKDRLCNVIKDASVVVIDSYLADIELYKRISEKVKIPVYLDDNRRIDYPRGFVVNGTIYTEGLNYPKKEDTTYLLDSQYIPLRREFWDVRKKEIRSELKSIMITFGGDDMRTLTPKILKMLNREYPKLTKNVIISKGFQNENVKEIEALKNKKTNLIYNPEAGKFKEIMFESDIAISAGGQTLYEFARIGIPAIGICVSDNQERNLSGWQKRGFIEYAGWYDDDNLNKKLKKSIGDLRGADIRKDKSAIGKRYVDGKGSLRVAKVVLSSFLKDALTLRDASFGDASEILNLANDEAVRQNSFHSEKIKWEEHLKWLKQKLNDSNHVFFVATMNDIFYGQVRFDINRDIKEATASISLAEQIRGLGLSSLILKKSIDKLLASNNDIKSIKAYTKEENIPSMRAFERAGFMFSENISVNGNKGKAYIKKVDYVNA
jgi:spore coat polysaccharide biosynthesis predicted glycosyltransferase SpsG/L-amino acid N-acyltransferase YncA